MGDRCRNWRAGSLTREVGTVVVVIDRAADAVVVVAIVFVVVGILSVTVNFVLCGQQGKEGSLCAHDGTNARNCVNKE